MAIRSLFQFLFSGQGVVTRREYNIFFLCAVAFQALRISGLLWKANDFRILYGLLYIVVSVQVARKRVRDFGGSRYSVIFMFVPLINLVLFYFLLFNKSKTDHSGPTSQPQEASLASVV